MGVGRRCPLDRFALLVLCTITSLYVLYARRLGQPLPAWGLLHIDSHAALNDEIAWAQFAYGTYATSASDLCNSVMLMEALHRLDAMAEKVLLYPRSWDTDFYSDTERQLLRIARKHYNTRLQPVDILNSPNVSDSTWAAGFTKLLSFNQTQYKRVLMLDSDGTILQPMDELFLLPASPVAMPRAYWLEERKLADHVMLVQPSTASMAKIMDQMQARKTSDFDMEIMNDVYGDRSIVLPHRPYALLSGEFRHKEHQTYLTEDNATWDATAVLEEAKYVHFSDWPLPKPWLESSEEMREKIQPKCETDGETHDTDCAERRIWQWLYDDFRARRKASVSFSKPTKAAALTRA